MRILVKAATHRRCGKALTNILTEMYTWSSTKKAISEYRNSDFQISGFVISSRKNIHCPSWLPHVAKKESKLELTATMIRQMMPEFNNKKNVIILYDSWYVKQNMVSIVNEYENLDLISNARSDSVIHDLPPAPGRKRHPEPHRK